MQADFRSLLLEPLSRPTFGSSFSTLPHCSFRAFTRLSIVPSFVATVCSPYAFCPRTVTSHDATHRNAAQRSATQCNATKRYTNTHAHPHLYHDLPSLVAPTLDIERSQSGGVFAGFASCKLFNRMGLTSTKQKDFLRSVNPESSVL